MRTSGVDVSKSPILLLVEDENLISLALAEELVSGGYVVVTAHDGHLAIEELRSDAARFQAVITDIRLGEGPMAGRSRTQLANCRPPFRSST
jgi:DNA-binding response OmpR family regulator